MSSSLKTIYHDQLPESPSLLVVYVKNATPDKDDDYKCDVGEFFRSSPDFATIDSEVLLYQYPVIVNDNFRWQDLLDSSFELLELLHSTCAASKDKARPLVFIGAGLGGLVIKQGLWKAREQLYRYRDLLDQISGIIFLTTPHLGKDESDTSLKLGTILRQYSKSAGQRAVAKEFLTPYQICSYRFAELGLRFPVLSTYDTEDSRSRSSRLSGRKSALVSLKGPKLTGLCPITWNRLSIKSLLARMLYTSNYSVSMRLCDRY